MRPTAMLPQKKESRMQKRQRYCRLMPLPTNTYHSTRKWGSALYTHHTTEMARGELTVEPAVTHTHTFVIGVNVTLYRHHITDIFKGELFAEPAIAGKDVCVGLEVS